MSGLDVRAQRGGGREAAFWDWFVKNEDALFAFNMGTDTIFQNIIKELRKVHRDLVFEIGPVQNGVREFVISAGGMTNAFPSVERLVAAAPPLPRWKIVAFRPRRDDISTITIGDIVVDPEDVMFTLEPDGNKFGITLFLGKLREFDKEIHTQIGFLLLDETLGEYTVETSVGYIAILPEEASNGLPKQPFRHLAVEFDRLMRERGLMNNDRSRS